MKDTNTSMLPVNQVRQLANAGKPRPEGLVGEAPPSEAGVRKLLEAKEKANPWGAAQVLGANLPAPIRGGIMVEMMLIPPSTSTNVDSG